MDKECEVLAGVRIFPEVGGQDGVGTLHADAKGFRYATTSGSDFTVSFLCKDVKKSFVLVETDQEDLEEERNMPVLHFQLVCPIKVGTETIDYVEFELPGNELSLHQELEMFVSKLEDKWGNRYPIEKPKYGPYPYADCDVADGYDSDPDAYYFFNNDGILERANSSLVDA